MASATPARKSGPGLSVRDDACRRRKRETKETNGTREAAAVQGAFIGARLADGAMRSGGTDIGDSVAVRRGIVNLLNDSTPV
ncbi:hypothetical protein AT302_07360 [Pandoraea norimbergensis]|uniref:Uncharacterized protein n=1 Tax=Pandoraea norimbergensis TaxID=93219 RepID=A0ABM5WI48_9BURK|nr:hypothetical protein AT302_07360 [Pandoraea norimbergensis]